jgi:hypothetical protein
MVEFTPAILAHLIIVGYKALKVENRNDYVVIEPLMDADAIENFTSNNAYAIPVGDHQAYEMAGRIFLLPDLKFYIDKEFIE